VKGVPVAIGPGITRNCCRASRRILDHNGSLRSVKLSHFAKEPSPRMGTAEGLLDETPPSYSVRDASERVENGSIPPSRQPKTERLHSKPPATLIEGRATWQGPS
jgi:hypothetical protein